VRVRRAGDGTYAFAAPPLLRDGPVDEDLVVHIAECLRIERAAIVDATWADNGPGWIAVLLESADAVRALEPGFIDLDLGVVGPHDAGADVAWELRAFFPKAGATTEDPVTGSLNASVAGWLLRTGRATAPYVAARRADAWRSSRTTMARSGSAAASRRGSTATSTCDRARIPRSRDAVGKTLPFLLRP
jgi:predicted PhzF superfamily epimerase YddE/YHI9